MYKIRAVSPYVESLLPPKYLFLKFSVKSLLNIGSHLANLTQVYY